MKKVLVVGYRRDQAKLVEVLQSAGVLEISELPNDEEAVGVSGLAAFRAEQIRQGISKVKFVRDFLARLRETKQGLISSLLPDRFELGFADFESIGSKVDFETIYASVAPIDTEIININASHNALEEKKKILEPWSKLDVPFSDIYDLKGIKAVLAHGNDIAGEYLKDKLAEAVPLCDLTIVNEEPDGVDFVLFFPPNYRSEVEAVFTALGIEEFKPDHKGKASDEIEDILVGQESLIKRRSKLQKEGAHFQKYEKELKILHDWLSSQLERHEVQERFGGTTNAFAFTGWIEAGQTDDLKLILSEFGDNIDFTVTEPEPDDKVPTQIRNPRWSKPFEVLTRLYGVPNYTEVDPTPVMGAFFCLFFGIALGDAGYGLVLAIFCLWLKSRLILTEAGKDWFDLFALGGASSMAVGVLTGSYFGLPKYLVPGFLERLVVLDTLQQALLFLLITLAIGVIHIIVGLSLECWDDLRRQRIKQAVYDSCPKLVVALSVSAVATAWVIDVVMQLNVPALAPVMNIGLIVLLWSVIYFTLASGGFLDVVAGLVKGTLPGSSSDGEYRPIEKIIAVILLIALIVPLAAPFRYRWAVFAAAAAVGLVASPGFRRAAAAFGLGLYNLYGMNRFLNDVLSYSRLFALGLATYMVGYVINLIAGLASGISLFGIPIGLLLVPIIALPLHVANLAINLLSAFVHPLRLQFVEFFGQFYENGGHNFAPFRFETEHMILKEE